MVGNWIFGLCLFPLLIEVTRGNSITFDLEAERKCENRDCPPGKRCAIQHIQWPMNMSFPVCMSKRYFRGFPVKMRVCELPPEPGNCGARFMRWYYNRYSQKCTLFKYQGCNGNMNNFKSRSECEASCSSQNTLQNDARHGFDPRALAVSRPLIVSDPGYVPMRTNQNSRTFSVQTRKKTKLEKEERRRKRRLEKQKRRRLRKLRRRRKKKGLRSKKRRRSGRLGRDKKGRKYKQRKRNKKNKKRKNKRKKNRKEKKKNKMNPNKDMFDITEGGVRFESNDILTSSTLIPEIKNKLPQTKTENTKPFTLFSILDPKKPTEIPMIER